MVTWQDVHVLERRSRDAYALAASLDVSLVREVGPAAGADTWLGATATAFAMEVRFAACVLDEVVDDVRRVARRLQHDANDLAATLRSAEALGGPGR